MHDVLREGASSNSRGRRGEQEAEAEREVGDGVSAAGVHLAEGTEGTHGLDLRRVAHARGSSRDAATADGADDNGVENDLGHLISFR